jgi:hypothetical protein
LQIEIDSLHQALSIIQALFLIESQKKHVDKRAEVLFEAIAEIHCINNNNETRIKSFEIKKANRLSAVELP